MESAIVLHEDVSRKREHALTLIHNIHHQPIKTAACIHCFSAPKVWRARMKDYHALFVPAGLDLMTSLLGALQP